MAAATRLDAGREIEAFHLRARALVVRPEMLPHLGQVDRLTADVTVHAGSTGGGVPDAGPLHSEDSMVPSPYNCPRSTRIRSEESTSGKL